MESMYYSVHRNPEIADLENRITELAAHLHAADYRLLTLLHEFDERNGWCVSGIRSLAHWLNWKCGINIGAAREKVRVAKALPNLPVISEAFREGRISYSKVRAMTRAATAENEGVLINVALHGTASQVERAVRGYRKCQRWILSRDEARQERQRHLRWYTDADGSVVVQGRLTPEQGAVLMKALEAAQDQAFEAGEENAQQDADPPDSPVGARRADALVRMAESFLASGAGARSGGERYMVHLHTDVKTLRQDGEHACCEVEDHSPVSAETARRMTCDASLVHILEEGGEPLAIGRRSRTIPPAIRRALRARDGGCRFPGCCQTRFTDAHHIVHWADGGETSLSNLVTLCHRHHKLVHERGYGVRTGPDGEICFTSPSGDTIPNCPASCFRGNFQAVIDQNHESGLRISPATTVPRCHAGRWDPSVEINAMLRRDGYRM